MYYEFTYVNKVKLVKRFASEREAREFAHHEGDHLLDYKSIGKNKA